MTKEDAIRMALQAGAKPSSNPEKWDVLEINDENLERFVELIVKECAKSVNDWYQNHEQIHWDPATYVLAHFGVEE